MLNKIYELTVDEKILLKHNDWTFILTSGYSDNLYGDSLYHYIVEVIPPSKIIECLNETYSSNQIEEARKELSKTEDFCSASEKEKSDKIKIYLSNSILSEETINKRKQILKDYARDIAYSDGMFQFLIFESTGCMFSSASFTIYFDEWYSVPGSTDSMCYYELTADVAVSTPRSTMSLMSNLYMINAEAILSEFTNIILSNKRYKVRQMIYNIGNSSRKRDVGYCAMITIMNYKFPDESDIYKEDVYKIISMAYDGIVKSNSNLECFLKLHHLSNNIFTHTVYYNYNEGSTSIILMIRPCKINNTIFDSISLSSIDILNKFPNDLVDESGKLIDSADMFNYNELLWAFFAKADSYIYFLNSSENVNFSKNNKSGCDIISIFGIDAGFGEYPIEDSPSRIYPIEEVESYDNFKLFKLPDIVTIPNYMRNYNNYFISVNSSYIEDQLSEFKLNSTDMKCAIIEGLSTETKILEHAGIIKSNYENIVYNDDIVIRFLCIYNGWYLFSIFSFDNDIKTSNNIPSVPEFIRNLVNKDINLLNEDMRKEGDNYDD